MIMRFSIVAASVLLLLLPGAASAGSNGASDRIIGLLALPQLFGDGPCDIETVTHSLALFESADGTVSIGEIRVDEPWKMAAEGGCGMLEIGVHLTGAGNAVQDFPAREYGYEMFGAIVYARRGNRFRIALQDGAAAWVEPMDGAEFHPLEMLVSEGINYLTDRWDGTVCAEPGNPGTCWKIIARPESRPHAMILGYREVRGELWFDIKLPGPETCGVPVRAITPIQGWISAHDNNGEPAIWFYSRGC